MTPILPILATVLLVAATFAASPPVTLRVDRLPLAVRGGGGKEWVCNGGVCELKEIPKKTSVAKKESSSEAKKAVTADDTGDKPGWLQQLKPLAVRGGGSKEWVCDGDVCELKPASKKKSKAKKGASSKASKAVSSDSSDNEPGWLQSLRTLVGGSRVSPLQRGLSFVAKLFGVDINSALVDEKEDGGKDDAPSVAAPGASKVPKKKQTKALSRAEQRAVATKERGAKGGRGGRAGRGGARAASSSALRIQRELRDFQTNPPPHCSVAVRPDNLNVWIITLAGVEGTVYAGEKYKLRVEFSKEYPTKPPSVYFLKPAPRHQHVYTNGDICLDLLGKGWKPQLTVRTLAVSILSILSSAREKGIPPDNSNHADNAPGKVQEGWLYHDDHC